MTSQQNSVGVDTCAQVADGNERPLRLVVGYTDDFGRTSCGISKTAHYRLRTLALVHARGATSTTIESYNQKMIMLEKWIREKRKGKSQAAEVIKEVPELRDLPGGMTVRTALRMMTTTIEERRNQQTKLSRLDLALTSMLEQHIAISLYALINNMHKLLPQEILDLIYTEIVGISKFVEFTDRYSAFNRTYDLPMENEDPLQRWYFNPIMMGNECASGLARAFFSKCILRLPADELLGQRLQCLDLADGVQISPQEYLNEIIVLVPRIVLDVEPSTDQSKWESRRRELAQNLMALKSLTKAKATITLDFREVINGERLVPASDFQSKWRSKGRTVYANDFSHPHGCPDRPFEIDAEELYNDNIVATILKDLAPLISLLSARGHTIAVIDKNSCPACSERINKLRELELQGR